jgi:hypothetical protein
VRSVELFFADLVCFYVGPRGGVRFDGFCEMPEFRPYHARTNDGRSFERAAMKGGA